VSTTSDKGPPPLVSVIVPTSGNRAARLQLAIASVWAQEGLGEQFDLEVIVVDDASTGPTEEVVRRFPGTRYVRYTRSPGAPTRNVSAVRNAGIVEASGDYVAFLDDDDLWLPNRLSRQVAVLEEAHEVEVAYSQRARVPGFKGEGWANVAPGANAPSGRVFETVGVRQEIPYSTVLVPREALDKVEGFDENLPISEVGDFTARLALFFRFRFVPGVVYIYAQSSSGSRSPEQRRTAWLTTRDNLLALIEGQPDEAELRKALVGATSWHVAFQSYRGGEFGRACREFLQWIAESRPLEGDAWARVKMKEMIFLLAAASDSPVEQASLCKEIKRAAAPRGLKQRLQMRALLADMWTSIALYVASGHRRDHKRAGSAAVSAILQNPLKPLSRPGLLRLLVRAIVQPRLESAGERVPRQTPQAVPSDSHPDAPSSRHLVDSPDLSLEAAARRAALSR
jgi:glycosyltransferase involved in cell wall biosynthesis